MKLMINTETIYKKKLVPCLNNVLMAYREAKDYKPELHNLRNLIKDLRLQG